MYKLKVTIIDIIVFVCFLLFFIWVGCPTLGFTPGLIACITGAAAIATGVGAIITMFFDWDDFSDNKTNVVMGLITIIGLAVLVIGCVISWRWFHVSETKNRISIKEISVEELTEKLPNYNELGSYSWADSETAATLAARKTGELTENASLFTTKRAETDSNKNSVSNVFTAVDKTGIVKYIPLEYADVFKWGKADTIPGYIKVDPVSQKSEFIKYPIKYSPSGYFGEDLNRYLRLHLPTEKFGEKMFQVGPDGKCYWVVERVEYAGFSWFTEEVTGIFLVDAQTGEITEYTLGCVPDWVTAIHGDTAMEYYNSYGKLINGYWNISNIGETATTDDFGYVNINGHLCYYTGITSVVTTGGDEANLGVLLYDAHTGEAFYCQVPGAEEYSAMGVAEGVLQNYKYTAAFPSLTLVDDELTYVMVLKDDNSVVKQYAMVNYKNYDIVTTGESLEKCQKKYAELLNKKSPDAATATRTTQGVTISDIKFITVEGETIIYINTDRGWYKKLFSEEFLNIKAGDTIMIAFTNNADIPEFVLIKEEK